MKKSWALVAALSLVFFLLGILCHDAFYTPRTLRLVGKDGQILQLGELHGEGVTHAFGLLITDKTGNPRVTAHILDSKTALVAFDANSSPIVSVISNESTSIQLYGPKAEESLVVDLDMDSKISVRQKSSATGGNWIDFIESTTKGD